MLVDDCLEDITLHTAVYKFQSERGMPMHPLPTSLMSGLETGLANIWSLAFFDVLLPPPDGTRSDQRLVAREI